MKKKSFYKSAYSDVNYNKSIYGNGNTVMTHNIIKNRYTYHINDIISRLNYIDLDISGRESIIIKENLVEKLRFDQLFNINVFLLNNKSYYNNEYIIYDLRSKKTETFLKNSNK